MIQTLKALIVALSHMADTGADGATIALVQLAADLVKSGADRTELESYVAHVTLAAVGEIDADRVLERFTSQHHGE